MTVIKVESKGNFNKALSYLGKLRSESVIAIFQRYGESGVAALAQATPVDTGLTADSWSFKITTVGKKTSLIFENSNVVGNVNVAVILQYGHATGSGVYVEGVDYINPAIKPIFDKIARDLWTEVTAL